MATTLFVTAELVRQFAILAQPVMPEACNKLLDMLAVSADARSFASLGAKGRLVGGTPIPEPAGVFPRYVDPAEEASKPTTTSAEAQAAAKAAKEAKRAAEREKAMAKALSKKDAT